MKAPTVYSKTAKKLPDRAAMNQLARSPRSLSDYSKVTPIRNDDPVPVVVQNLRKR